MALLLTLALAQEPVPVSLSYRDGLQFKADDGSFQATLGGRVIAHYRTIFDRPDDPRGSPDTGYLRQARIDVQGKVYKQFDFRLYLDFPTGAAANAGTVQDAWIGWSPVPEFGVKVGQMKEPFSQEQTTTLRATDFVERSILDRLAPGRDIGVLFFGRFGLLDYEAGAFNGAGRAVADTNDEKDLATRLRVTPLDGLRLGVSGTYGDVDNGSFNLHDLMTTELRIQFVDATAGVVDGRRTRLGAELSWIWSSFGLRAEGARRRDRDVEARAWNASVTWLLTGEKKILENRIAPESPWGAVELAVRAAGLDVDEVPAGNAERVTTFTVGVNWHVTRNVRISPNYVLERFGDEVAGEDALQGFLVRFQIDF